MVRAIFIAFLSVAGFTTNVYACCGGGSSLEEGKFRSADLDRNEQLDPIEAKAVYNLGNNQVFEKYDKSGEGVITRLEFMEYMRLRGENE